MAGGPRAAEAVAVSPAVSSDWEAYYKEASRRRRALGKKPDKRFDRRYRKRRERVVLGLSTLFVASLTMVFYLVLR